jgi:ParB-like chromosome segregation protein Spo0J
MVLVKWKTQIAKDLWPLAVPIDTLDGLPGNPRRGDVEAIKRSYTRFGQLKPVTAQFDEAGERGTVSAGNHQLLAATELGWERLAVVKTDHDPATQAAWALADNRTGDLGTYDDEALLAMLRQIEEDEGLLSASSYSDDDIKDLLFQLEKIPITGTSAGERSELYEAAGIRSVVLPYPEKDHEKVVRWLELVRVKYGRTTNSEAIYCLLEEVCAPATDQKD